jgi:hypothetical protein
MPLYRARSPFWTLSGSIPVAWLGAIGLLGAGCSRGVTPSRGAASDNAPATHPYDVQRPLDTPVAFSDPRITTVNGLAFARDGRTLYTSNWVPDRDSTGRRRLRIFEWRFSDGVWTGPVPASFSSTYTDYQPVFAPNGARLYFQSTRPRPGAAAEVLQNLWFVDRVGDAWSDPRFATDLNTDAREGYVAPLRDGTVYFNSDRPGGRGLQDFYRSQVLPDDRFAPPVRVAELNTVHSENDLTVDPLGRFVIFNRYVEATREIDLYIAFASGDAWGTPRLLDNVNALGWELTPALSPNGRYLFFTRDAAIYQVDVAALLYDDEPVRGRRRRS